MSRMARQWSDYRANMTDRFSVDRAVTTSDGSGGRHAFAWAVVSRGFEAIGRGGPEAHAKRHQ